MIFLKKKTLQKGPIPIIISKQHISINQQEMREAMSR